MGNPFDDYLEESINIRQTAPADVLAREKAQLATVPFYPNQKYLQKKWKPEQFSVEMIEQIARAQALAEKQKILPPAQGQYFFPTQLIENRPGNFGMSDILTVQEGKDPYSDWAKKMQLSPPQQDEFWRINENDPNRFYAARFPDYISSREDYNLASEENARLAAMFYALKGRRKTPLQTVEAWNGKGQKKRDGKIIADSKNHLSKVQTMLQMLDHPANAEIKKVWQQYYGQALKE